MAKDERPTAFYSSSVDGRNTEYGSYKTNRELELDPSRSEASTVYHITP